MQALPPAPEPDGADQQKWLSIVSGYAFGGPVIDTPIDCPADIVQLGPDGMVTLIQVKWVPPKLRPGHDWAEAIKEWHNAYQDGRLESWEKSLAGALDESSAQNATAAASAMMFSLAVLENANAEDALDAARRLDQLLDEPQSDLHELDNSTTDVRYVASWLNPVDSRTWRLAAKPIGVSARSRQISGESLERQLVGLLSHWHDVSQGRPAFLRSAELVQFPGRSNRRSRPEELCAIAAATCATQAALGARSAILTQPWGTSRDVVAKFAADWLNFHPTPGLVEATANALLFAQLDNIEPSDGSALTDELKKDVCRRHNSWRPIGETQLCGLTVDYLARTIGSAPPGANVRTVGDNVVDPQNLEDVALGRIGEWDDPRVGRVLTQLKPEELRVAIAYGGGGTWTEAALSCGLPEEYGEHVRRKLRRLGQQFVNRIGQSAA